MKNLLILSITLIIPCSAMNNNPEDKSSQNSQASWNSTDTAPTESYSLESFDSMGSLGLPGPSSLSEPESQEDNSLEGLLERIRSAEQQGTLEHSETVIKDLKNILSSPNAHPKLYQIAHYTSNEKVLAMWHLHNN